MIVDNKESFIPKDAKIAIVEVISSKLTGHKSQQESKRSLDELRQLLQVLDLSYEKEYIQHVKHIDPAYVVGDGKIKEIAQDAENGEFNLLVFDIELSPGQHRNIQEITKVQTIDRNMIILEIFAKHAASKDAKLQVEIAKLEYLLPRLNSMWGKVSRPTGGSPGIRGGLCETKKELEHRYVKDRISFYKKESEAIEKTLSEQKKKRDKNTFITSLVGYTNAGKSSLMNRLCHENVLEEDKLFATVDATYRTLDTNFKPPIVMVDTVGFISNLPTQLIKGFRTTLASALEAHFLVIVSDIAHPSCREQLEVTFEVLKDLKADHKPNIIVFNKKDRIEENSDAQKVLLDFPNHLLVSSFESSDMELVRDKIIDHFENLEQELTVLIPYEDGLAHAKTAELCNVLGSENQDQGIQYKIKINPLVGIPPAVKKYLENI